MANYSVANLVKAQLKLAGEFATNDQRYRSPEVFKVFLNGAEQFFPSYKTLKTSNSRALEANYFKRTASALSTGGESHDHTGTGGDSGTISLSWTSYSSNFSMTLKQADTSIYSWQEEFTDNVRNKIIDFANGLDTAAGLFLFDNRTGVNTASVKGSFNSTNQVYEIDETYKDEVATLMKLVVDTQAYQGVLLDVVCDPFMYSEILKLSNQGAGNATNTSFQFLNTNFVLDPTMLSRATALDATYVKGFACAVPRGLVACADWIPTQNRIGKVTSVNMYGSFLNPVDGLQYATHTYDERSDGTSVNGQTQDVLTQSQMFIHLSWNVAPDSTTNRTPIFAFAVK